MPSDRGFFSAERVKLSFILSVTVPTALYGLRCALFGKLPTDRLQSELWLAMGLLGVLLLAGGVIPYNRKSLWLSHPRWIAGSLLLIVLLSGKLIANILFVSNLFDADFFIACFRAVAVAVAAGFAAGRVSAYILREEAKFRRMAAAGSVGLWVLDLKSKQLEWERHYGPAFGYPESAEHASDFWSSMTHPDDLGRVRASFEAAILDPQAKAWHMVYRFRRADGTYAWVLERCVFERDGAGVGLKAYGGIMDITERMAVEEELRRRVAERTRELVAVTHSVSHDLRSPLSAILGYGDMMLASGALTDPRAVVHLRQIIANAERMGEFINGMLDQTAEHPREVVDFSELFEDLRSEFNPRILGFGGRLLLSGGTVRCRNLSKIHLYRVLQNLVDNSCKYRNTAVAPEIRVSVESYEGRVVVRVEDNGVGIPREVMPGLFRHGVRGAAVGSIAGHGIGLANVELLVLRMGGVIKVDSVEGEGTIFTIDLPCAEPAR